MLKVKPIVLAMAKDRYSIVLIDKASGNPEHGTDCGGEEGAGYTEDEVRSILADRYCLPEAEIKELIASACR